MDMQGRFDGISPRQQQGFPFGLTDHEGYTDPDMYMSHGTGHGSQSSGSPYEHNMNFFTECPPIPAAYPSPEVESDSSQADGLYTTQPQGHLLPPPMVKQESEALQEGAIVGITPQNPGSSSSAAPPEASTAKPPAKRKRENRYKNAPPSVLSRRRAQNRASQRAYRERKDQRIKDLENMLEESKRHFESLCESYQSMRLYYSRTARITPPGVLPDEMCMGSIPSMPQTPMTQHRLSSSSATSQISHISQMQSASPMAIPANMPVPPVANPMIPGFDPSTVPNMGVPPSDQLNNMYLYSQLGGGFPS